MKHNRFLIKKNGFIALIAVVVLAMGIFTFSLVTYSAVYSYYDSVNRKELRIQANLNAKSCLKTVALMYAKDFFLNGEQVLNKFGCTADIVNDMNGRVTIKVKATLEEVSDYEYTVIDWR